MEHTTIAVQLRPNGSENTNDLLDIRTPRPSGVACWGVNAKSQQRAFVKILPSIEPFTSNNSSFVPCDRYRTNGSLRNENRASTVVMGHVLPGKLRGRARRPPRLLQKNDVRTQSILKAWPHCRAAVMF